MAVSAALAFYSGNPATSNKDAARFYAGDTVPDDYLVGDAEYDFALEDTKHTYTDPYSVVTTTYRPKLAAALICEKLAREYARESDKTINGAEGRSITNALSQKSETFARRAKELRAQGSVSPGNVFGVPLPRV